MVIILSDFLVLPKNYQISFLPQVKQSAISSNKYGIYIYISLSMYIYIKKCQL